MKFKNLLLVLIVVFFGISVSSVFAQDNAHKAAMSALTSFLADPTAGADYSSQRPEAVTAAQALLAFPPAIQKRLEKVVLMILQESTANANRAVDSFSSSGPEGAFRSFSPAVQREIEGIARELEKDPEFTKKAGMLK